LLSVKSGIPFNGNHRFPIKLSCINLFDRFKAEFVESIDHVNERQKRQEHGQNLKMPECTSTSMHDSLTWPNCQLGPASA
jgi:hypothetical protein